MGCSTYIPTFEENAQQSHIPESFRNAHSPSLHQNLTQHPLGGTHKESTQTDIPLSLEQFMAFIDDKPLHELLQIALKKNTNVLSMISRIKQAKSQMKIHRANIFPTINAGLNSNYVDNRTLSQSSVARAGANSVNANISMSWELDLFGKLNALRQSSKKAYLEAQSNLAYAQISLIAEASTLYFNLRDNAYGLQIIKATLKNVEELEKIAADRFRLGLIDINTYQSFVADIVGQKNAYENLTYTFEQNQNALLVLLNISLEELKERVDFLDTAYDTLPHIAAYHIDKMPSEILLSRPDIQSSIYALHAQLYKQTNANAARLPNISLNSSIGEILYSTTTNVGAIVFQIANSITTPLLNRTNLKQNYLIQKELSNEAFLTLQNNINIALGEIENALFDVESKKRQVENIQYAYKIGLQSYQSNSVKNTKGLLDKNDFLGFENTYLNLKSQLFSAQTNEIFSLIVLFKALGGNLGLSQKTDNQSISLQGRENEILPEFN